MSIWCRFQVLFSVLKKYIIFSGSATAQAQAMTQSGNSQIVPGLMQYPFSSNALSLSQASGYTQAHLVNKREIILPKIVVGSKLLETKSEILNEKSNMDSQPTTKGTNIEDEATQEKLITEITESDGKTVDSKPTLL